VNLDGANLTGVCLVGTSLSTVIPPPQLVKIPLQIAEFEHTSTKEIQE
jgi:hypothetical protein